VIEVAPRLNGRGSERRGEPVPFTAPPAKAGILSTIKSKPRAGRK